MRSERQCAALPWLRSAIQAVCFIVVAQQGVAHADADQVFEREVRPLLVAKCFRCHNQGSKSKSGLQLNSRESLLAGGARGPAIQPGDPEESLLVKAVRRDGELRMPPDQGLDQREIDSLVRWIKDGAEWPTASAVEAESRQQLWSLQPVRSVSVPEVNRGDWPQTEIDHFILARLEAAGLSPSPQADRLALLRRVTFDLIGLPPTREECESFLADHAPDAYRRVVERLLASKHYGERWARHWMDLCSYAETNGTDSESPKPYAYSYRDYLIDAFNSDVPYDQFVREQIAGDLIENPRFDSRGAQRLSPIGSYFLWFGEFLPLPFDPITSHGNELELQIDTIGKTFLGLTLACARCHDHKFDPVTQRDYYALGGILASTSNRIECLDSTAKAREIEDIKQQLAAIDRETRILRREPQANERYRAAVIQQADETEKYLLAIGPLLAGSEQDLGPLIQATVAKRPDLNPDRLARWLLAARTAIPFRDRILYPFAKLAQHSDADFALRATDLSAELGEMNGIIEASGPRQILSDFEQSSLDDWSIEGTAFRQAVTDVTQTSARFAQGQKFLSSYGGSDALTGWLTSPPIQVGPANQYLCLRVAGNAAGRLNVSILRRGAVATQLLPAWNVSGGNSRGFALHVMNLQLFMGQEIQIQFRDDSREGHLLVDDLFFTDRIPIPNPALANSTESFFFTANTLITTKVRGASSLSDLSARYARLIQQAVRPPAEETPAETDREAWRELRDWSLDEQMPVASGLAVDSFLTPESRKRLELLQSKKRELEQRLPASSYSVVSHDENPHDMPIHERGDGHQPGALVERGLPSFLNPPPLTLSHHASGRLQLADWLASATNPLTPRVIVNRLWRHHFGRGLVPTVDNFGKLGEQPSHPDLLDYLSCRLIASRWSLKALHRLMCLSATYQQSHRASPRALEVDPDNRLIHHMPIRRLEAECVRDAMLAASGALNRDLHGPPIAILKPDQEEGSADTPGVAPGEWRRSIYLEARRNTVASVCDVFDYPKTATTTGYRQRSVTPQQSLFLLNSEFVHFQAEKLAERVCQHPGTAAERVRLMYLDCYGRNPRHAELEFALRFVGEQEERYSQVRPAEVDASWWRSLVWRIRPTWARKSKREPTEQAWKDLCHILLCSTEFRYVR